MLASFGGKVTKNLRTMHLFLESFSLKYVISARNLVAHVLENSKHTLLLIIFASENNDKREKTMVKKVQKSARKERVNQKSRTFAPKVARL